VNADSLTDIPPRRAGTQGRLRIYLGAAPGVGKTYAMLSDARGCRARGTDVVLGLVDSHGLAETRALCKGLNALPSRTAAGAEGSPPEFDVDAALARRPELVLVDDAGHRNPEASRHSQRWQDIEELLEHGIDVYTTLNVQNIERLKDVVYACTEIRFRDTVPDVFLERAEELRLVDLSPDDILERLSEGKVFLAQPERKARDLFRKPTLASLRNLALRIAVEHQEALRWAQGREHGAGGLWPTSKKVLICIDDRPTAEQLIRAGRRLASLLHADWIVVYVETARAQRLSESEREQVLARLRQAEEFGAEITTLTAGVGLNQRIIALARQKKAGRVVLEQPEGSVWQRWQRGSIARALQRRAGDLDVFLIAPGYSSLAQDTLAGVGRPLPGALTVTRDTAVQWEGYFWSVGIPIAATLVSTTVFRRPQPTDYFIVYLVGVLFIASRFGFWPSAVAAILSVLAIDYLLIPPYFSFAVARPQDVVTLFVFLLGALVASRMTADLRLQSQSARQREQRVRFLYEFAKELGAVRTMEDIASVAARQISQELRWQCSLLLSGIDGRVALPDASETDGTAGFDPHVAQWVFDNRRAAGWGTGSPASARDLYLPVSSGTHRFGVLALRPTARSLVLLPEQRRLLDSVLTQIGQAMERIRLTEEAHAANVHATTEELRNSLLSAIAHDFRTPLASIVAAASALLQRKSHLSEQQSWELTQTILEEGQRMTKLANNTLQMARLEAGTVSLHREWYPLEEIIGAAISRMEGRLQQHLVDTRLPAGVPMAQVDEVMIVQVLENLIENAIKYTPAGTRIEVGAEEQGDQTRFWVADTGPGLPVGEERKLFEKFYQGPQQKTQGGVGLGLTICRIIVEAHGGQIRASNRVGAGAEFSFTIPHTEAPPRLAAES